MVTITNEYFDLRKIMDSGQCFRMLPLEDGSVRIVSEDKVLYAQELEGGGWELACSKAEFEAYWRRYFDLDRDYAPWFEKIDPRDEYLTGAAQLGRGLRVLDQSPWETLVAFIVSQRKTVPAITTCLERLSNEFGEVIATRRGPVHLLPTAARLAELTPDDLAGCALGYRTGYVLDAARKVASGEVDLQGMTRLPTTGLVEELSTIQGVGAKVAGCIALYGYHRLGHFPIDVWIRRVLDEHYPAGFPFGRYRGYAGFLQLLMFYEARHRP